MRTVVVSDCEPIYAHSIERAGSRLVDSIVISRLKETISTKRTTNPRLGGKSGHQANGTEEGKNLFHKKRFAASKLVLIEKASRKFHKIIQYFVIFRVL